MELTTKNLLNVYFWSKEIAILIKESDLEINSREDAEQSLMIKEQLKSYRIKIEETRKDSVKPYNVIVKWINGLAAIILWPIELAERSLNKKQIAYNAKVDDESRKQQQEMWELWKQNDAHEEAIVEINTIQREANRQKVQRWINYNKKIIRVDWDLLPKKYRNIKDMVISPLQIEIKKDMKAWIRIDWITFED